MTTSTTAAAAPAAWWSNPVTESVLSARQAVPACCNAFLLLFVSVCAAVYVSTCLSVCVFMSTGYLWPLALSARLQFDAVAFHFGHKCALRRTTLAVNANRFLVLCCTGIVRVDVVAHVAASTQSDIQFILEPQNCSATPSSWTPPPESHRCRRVTRSRSRSRSSPQHSQTSSRSWAALRLERNGKRVYRTRRSVAKG